MIIVKKEKERRRTSIIEETGDRFDRFDFNLSQYFWISIKIIQMNVMFLLSY